MKLAENVALDFIDQDILFCWACPSYEVTMLRLTDFDRITVDPDIKEHIGDLIVKPLLHFDQERVEQLFYHNRLQLEHGMKRRLYFAKELMEMEAKRDEANQALSAATDASFDVLQELSDIHDPELTKCVVAACLQILFRGYGFDVSGVDDNKTAADARAGKPGDLTIEKEGKSVVAIEVKDKTQSIDWNNIERAKRIIRSHPELDAFMFVLESRDSATNSLINEMVNSSQLATNDGRIITILSLYALYHLARPIVSESEMIQITSGYIAQAPSVKPETKALWLEKIK